MNRKRSLLLLIMILSVVTCLGWKLLNLPSILDTSPIRRANQLRCDSYLPPEDLTAADLIGTWVAGYSDQSDTLILREDNRYKQIIHLEKGQIDYQTGWQEWWLERKDDGLVYLHLKGMRFCALSPEKTCDVSSGFGYDFCVDQSIEMGNEGILLVLTETNKNYDPSSNLTIRFPLGSEDSWVYFRDRSYKGPTP